MSPQAPPSPPLFEPANFSGSQLINAYRLPPCLFQSGKSQFRFPAKWFRLGPPSHAPFTHVSRTNRKRLRRPLARNPEVDVSHGSRLWPCGSSCRRGEIVGAGSLGMVRPRGSSPRVLSRDGGEMEFRNVPRGTNPLPNQRDSGPRPGFAPKTLRMRKSHRAGIWPAALRMRKCGMLEVG